ncbi:MAG: Coenzyme F420 hydrogenase/dehydrogenase, beta subunit C-terminal domain [Phycisphaerales bacterium]|nr:Coenzyme F420 hydrogenase/dehydrogenase, beta subunit C-terminal domain [Phycisphaerales bacterium]
MTTPQIIPEIVGSQLCSGCGVCTALQPSVARMVDDREQGRRPLTYAPAGAFDGHLATLVCPGIRLEHAYNKIDSEFDGSLLADWGPVLGVWEGHAGDAEIRRAGSSGGAASALALYAIERGGMYAVLHTAAREDIPYLNQTVVSRSRAELLARTGSRYAPASPGDGLGQIESAPAPCVFIGKPCDVAGATMAARARPALAEKLGLTIAFFCAGVPSTRGTLDLLKKVGVDDPESVESIRYRGNGWPGRWTVRFRTPAGVLEERSLSYEESWGFLTKYVQWRCRLCPDHTGEFADIAVGDPWYRPVQPGEQGKSLIVARTPRGREVLHAAAAAGYIVLETRDASLLPRSQPNLFRARGAVWGRLLALRLAGIPTPQFKGFSLFRAWLRLPLRKKISSIVGTWRRIGERDLRRTREVQPFCDRAPLATPREIDECGRRSR